jgi:hypothetical protein
MKPRIKCPFCSHELSRQSVERSTTQKLLSHINQAHRPDIWVKRPFSWTCWCGKRFQFILALARHIDGSGDSLEDHIAKGILVHGINGSK